MYEIVNVQYTGTYNNGGTSIPAVLGEFRASSAADLPAQNVDCHIICGCDGLDIATGDRYIWNGTAWILQPSQNAFSNVYTTDEIDTMITTIYQYMMYYHTQQVSIDGSITFYTFGETVENLKIYGNVQQGETPEFVGVKTDNLHNPETDVFGFIDTNGNISPSSVTKSTDFIPCVSGQQYVLRVYKTGTLQSTNQRTVDFYLPDRTYIELPWGERVTYALTADVEYHDISFVVPTGAGFLRFCYDTGFNKSMLNIGTAALPFEPFGYKIPVSCGGQTEPIYIGAPLRKALDGSNAVDIMYNTGTITRAVDENGNALASPTIQTINFPSIPTVSGENTLTVDTDLIPSKIVISGGE